MSRTVIALGATGSLLEAADRIRVAPEGEEIALVLPVGAALARSGVLLAVAHQLAGDRPFSIVSPDPRARAIAASAHIRAYATIDALERHDVDPTEPDVPVVAAARPVIAKPPVDLRRRAVAAALLFAAAIVALAFVMPSATVTVAASGTLLTMPEFELRAGPGGEVPAEQYSDTISARVTGVATGKRTVETKATGLVKFTNKTTDDIRLPRGTLVRSGTARFVTTEDHTLARSLLVPFFLSNADYTVEALDPGPGGNVAAGTIVSSDPARYDATNPQAIRGGDSKQITIVSQEDYDKAAKEIPAALDAAAKAQLAKWAPSVRSGSELAGGAFWAISQQLAASEVVGKDLTTFEVPVNAAVLAFAVPKEEPRRSALTRLRTTVNPGNDIDDASAKVDIVTTRVAQNGVTFRVRASGLQFRRPNAATLRSALAGHSPNDVEATLRARNLKLVRVERWPTWWPLLPILDSRITIVEGAAQ